MYREQPDKFRDRMGKLLIQKLFLEHQYDLSYAVYTIKEEDYEYQGVVYPSLKRLYLEIADPTEWEFVQQCFYNWKQWERVQKCFVLRDHVPEWRDELEVKLKSEAIKEMREKAKGPQGTGAAKWLAEKGWAPKRSAGAPSKQEKERQTRIDQRVHEDIHNDLERMEKWH